MPTKETWLQALSAGALDAQLSTLYGRRAGLQYDRIPQAIESFASLFGQGRDLLLFSGPGRTEIGGNHTDHNHGSVLAGAVNLDILAVVSKNEDDTVRIYSEGHNPNMVCLDDLACMPSERGRSNALVRGLCALFVQRGYQLGGLDIYTTSDVLTGSGLSSSAAFEVLLGQIFNQLFNEGRLTPLELSILARQAENEFFGKPCGLMDQLACATGGLIGIDFSNMDNPDIQQVFCDISKSGHHLCIVNAGGSHADLTDAYASVPNDMRAVAGALGVGCLREVDEDLFWRSWNALRARVGDRPLLRAAHFFADNERVKHQMEALGDNRFDAFLSLVRASGQSSFMYLQNVYPQADTQGLSLALCLSDHILQSEGAFRVHGGGFAGTIQAFVPQCKLERYVQAMDGLFGDGSCQTLEIRSVGSTQLVF